MIEVWKDCLYNNVKYSEYRVSNLGRVKRIYKSGKEKILKAWKCSKGYLMVTFCIKGVKTACLVHRLVANAFIPNIGNYYSEVDHKDTNKINNEVSNLCWVTSRNNNYNPLTHERKKANGNNNVWKYRRENI